MNPLEILGYLALLLLIAGFAMKTIDWLRYFAVASSVAVALYGVLAPNYLLLVLGLLMAGVNIFRLVEMRGLVGKVQDATAAAGAPPGVDWLLPYMRPVDMPKDHVIFRKGDAADAIYFLSAGRVRFEEIGVEVGKGALFGEIGIFTIDQIRTATAVCLEPCSILLITAERARELYYQNPNSASIWSA